MSAAVHAARRDGGQGALRRLFVYGLAFVGAMVAPSGMAGLLRAALEALGATVLQREAESTVALGLALTLVGLPLWLLAWRTAQRSLRASSDEAAALPRRLYLAAVRAVALAVATFHAVEVARWLLQVNAYEPAALARLLVWGAFWAYHERAAVPPPFGSPATRRLDRLFVYVAATAGLLLAAGGVGVLVEAALELLYDLSTATLLVGSLAVGDQLRAATAVAVVGAALWWWHWRVVARDDAGSTGWLVYVFLVGILNGTVAVISGVVVTVFRTMTWLLGAAEAAATTHFAPLPAAVSAVIVGAGVWGHHRAAMRERPGAAAPAMAGPERAYRYLVVAAGSVTAAAGLAVLLAIAIDLLVREPALVGAPGDLREAVAGGLTGLVVGLPLWAVSWARVQRAVRHEPDERSALARRVYIFGGFGVAVLTVIASASTVLYALFEALLEGSLSAAVIDDQRWGLALIATAGAAGVHLGLVLREDRTAAPPAETGPPQRPGAVGEVVVVAADPDGLAGELAQRLQVPVTGWRRADAPGDAPGRGDAEAVVAALADVAAPRALVLVASDGGLEVVPLCL